MAQDNTPPVAKKVPNQLIIHGDTLIDEYFWLRDKNSTEVINHLYAENTYADNVMKESSFLQKVLYEEFKSRRKESFSSRPRKRKGYFYYNRYEKGKDYAIILRKKDTADAKEQIVLDVNKLAEENPYVSVSGYHISPDQRLLYYGIDNKGNRVQTCYLKNIDKDTTYPADKISDVMDLIWATDNKTVYYTKPEAQTLRQYRVYKHRVGTAVESDSLIFEEPDKTMEINLGLSTSKQYLIFSVSKTKSNECWYFPADGNHSVPKLFLKREQDVLYNINHLEGNEFIVFTRNNKELNGKIMTTKITEPDPSKWKTLIAHRDNVLLSDHEFTKDFLILAEKENAQDRLRFINRKTNESVYFDPGIPNYSIGYAFEDYEYATSDEMEISWSNMVTPSQTFLYDLVTGEKKFVTEDTILGAYKASDYETVRIFATARDGKQVPVTLSYKKGLVLDGKNPCLLLGYGSYGAPSSTGFDPSAISYLDRGFVVAQAHIRGSNDLGRQWYEDGKMFNKKNTFYDFIDISECLIQKGYTNKEKLAINGGSAGGLLMGAVTNMRPDLFKCVVANVPFVDVINTMLDETLPLTTFEFDEWGNPKKKEEYKYIRTYSPYENVERKNYPAMLVTSGYNDSQVAYWEPAKWVSKLRDLKTDTNLLLFKTNMDAGHGGASGRYGAYKEAAFQMAFIMRSLGVKEEYITIRGKITDEFGAEIPFVNVYIEGTTNGTTANADGEFALTVKQGEDQLLVFQTLGYKTHKEKLDLNTQVSELKVKMKSENIQIQEVVIKANSRDPAYAIIKEAIKRRKENLENVKSYSADIYMKANVKLVEIPKKIPFFINKKDIPDSNNLGIIYLSESVAKYYFQRPDKKKEEMIASKVAGTKTGFSWNRVEDVFVNFYEPSIDLGFYSERPFVSPIATGALLSYKYKYLGTFYDGSKPIHKIKVTPRRKGDPLFNGEIYISEENYQIYSTDLFITKDAQIEFADTVHLKQEMVKVNDSIYMPVQLQLYSHFKIFGFAAKDMATAAISNYVLNKPFPKKFFGNEVFKIEESANKKDTSFWSGTRPSILSEEESKHYNHSDSTLAKKETKEYKDSVAKASRQPRFDIGGFSMRNNETGVNIYSNPIFDWVNYNTVEGTRVKLILNYTKRNKETRKATGISGLARYGFDNKQLFGAARFYRIFDPKNSQRIIFRGGRYIKQYNQHEPIGDFMNAGYTLFYKSNFQKLYAKYSAEAEYFREIVNGVYSNVSVQYNVREALMNKSFYYWTGPADKHFTSNDPLNPLGSQETPAFATHKMVQVAVGIKWIPFAKYETYPTGKHILDTRWPEFSFAYKKGIATKAASFNYDYLEAGVGKDMDLRVWGRFSFDVLAGMFFNNQQMNFIDYKHFSGNQTIFLSNKQNSDAPLISTRDGISEFHALDYYKYSTNDKYIELHASHNFRGFFIGKIPLLRKTKIYEVAGVNALFTPKTNYTEVFIGADKIFKVFRFDVGTNVQNLSGKKLDLFYRFGFRLGIFG
jgi:oligopeptidase B